MRLEKEITEANEEIKKLRELVNIDMIMICILNFLLE